MLGQLGGGRIECSIALVTGMAAAGAHRAVAQRPNGIERVAILNGSSETPGTRARVVTLQKGLAEAGSSLGRTPIELAPMRQSWWSWIQWRRLWTRKARNKGVLWIPAAIATFLTDELRSRGYRDDAP